MTTHHGHLPDGGLYLALCARGRQLLEATVPRPRSPRDPIRIRWWPNPDIHDLSSHDALEIVAATNMLVDEAQNLERLRNMGLL